MKKSIIILILILSIFAIGCSNVTKVPSDFSGDETKIKDTIDLVLSYENGYDDVMKKHISEINFKGLNFVEFYTMYIGEIELQDYQSEVISIREEEDKYIAAVVANIKALSTQSHTHADGTVHEGGEQINGNDIPMEITLDEKDGELFIEEILGYENLQKAKELNEAFR